jgi:hypothetical protein
MATQIVLDYTGDTRHDFDTNDTKSLLEAEQRFKELTRVGFVAAERTASGDVIVRRAFDPAMEETVFFPRLIGG